MRILVNAIALDNQNTGIHYYVKDMIGALATGARRHEYILLRERPDPSLNLQQISVVGTRPPIGGALWRLGFLLPFLIPHLAAKHGADAVLEPAHFGPFNLPRRIKRITIIHDLTPIKFPKLQRWHAALLQGLFLRRILRRADLVITDSMNTSRDVISFDRSLKSRTHCIYPSVNEQAVRSTAHSLPDRVTGPYMLCIGTLEPRKNLEVLVQAYEQYRSSRAGNLKLVIAGGYGWKYQTFLAALDRSPYRQDIALTGYVSDDDKAQLLQHCRFFVFPSLYEGFGLPVLEAIHHGKALIVSDTSSLPEVAGECALYVDPKNAADLAEKMARLDSDDGLRKTLEDRCATQAAKFSWQRYATEFEDLMSRLSDS